MLPAYEEIRLVSNFDVEHQEQAYRLVQRALTSRRVPHAYMFSGPEGVGKETFARGLAKVLLCADPVSGKSPEGEPQLSSCGTCRECELFDAGNHPDLHLIHRLLIRFHDDPTIRKRKGLDIGVDVIRQFVIDRVGSKPLRDRAKVFIVREADAITTQAQNALLKTLEEPPATTFIILLVSAVEGMLPTVRSRCHVTRFGTLPNEFVAAKLRSLVEGVTCEQAEFLARFSQGSLGLAVQLAEDGVCEVNAKVVETLGSLTKKSVTDTSAQLHSLADELAKKFTDRDEDISTTEAQRRGLQVVLAAVATWYRDVLHMTVEVKDLVANASMLAALSSAAQRATPGRAVAAIQHVASAQTQLDRNVNTKLALDALLIRLQRLAIPA